MATLVQELNEFASDKYKSFKDRLINECTKAACNLQNTASIIVPSYNIAEELEFDLKQEGFIVTILPTDSSHFYYNVQLEWTYEFLRK